MTEIAAVHRPQTQSNDISKSGNGFARIPRRKECWGMGRWRWGDWLFWTAAGVFFFALDVGAYLLYEHWSHPPEPASRSAVSPRHAPALQSVEAEQAAAVARANVQSVAQDRHPGAANPIPVHAVRPLDALQRCFYGRVYEYIDHPDGSKEAVQLSENGHALACNEGWVIE